MAYKNFDLGDSEIIKNEILELDLNFRHLCRSIKEFEESFEESEEIDLNKERNYITIQFEKLKQKIEFIDFLINEFEEDFNNRLDDNLLEMKLEAALYQNKKVGD